jgi:hypothetical protein
MRAVGDTHWAAGITAVATAITAVGVIFAGLAAVWAGRQVREAERTRHATTAIELASRWEGEPLVASRKLALTYRTKEALRDGYLQAKQDRSDAYFILQRLPDFFEDLGVMERMGGLGLEWIRLTLGSAVQDYWRAWQPIVQAVRDAGQPTMGENFERLAQRLATVHDSAQPEWHRLMMAPPPSG